MAASSIRTTAVPRSKLWAAPEKTRKLTWPPASRIACRCPCTCCSEHHSSRSPISTRIFVVPTLGSRNWWPLHGYAPSTAASPRPRSRTASAKRRVAAVSTAAPPRLCPCAPMRAGSISGCCARTCQAASTSYALAAKEYCVWLVTVEVTPRAPNGSSTKAARPAPVSVSAWVTCTGATPRLPGTMMTSGRRADAPVGRNSWPSTVMRGISPGVETAWW